jgi:hypothetical protein
MSSYGEKIVMYWCAVIPNRMRREIFFKLFPKLKNKYKRVRDALMDGEECDFPYNFDNNCTYGGNLQIDGTTYYFAKILRDLEKNHYPSPQYRSNYIIYFHEICFDDVSKHSDSKDGFNELKLNQIPNQIKIKKFKKWLKEKFSNKLHFSVRLYLTYY